MLESLVEYRVGFLVDRELGLITLGSLVVLCLLLLLKIWSIWSIAISVSLLYSACGWCGFWFLSSIIRSLIQSSAASFKIDYGIVILYGRNVTVSAILLARVLYMYTSLH